MKNRLTIEKIEITGVRIWLNCSQLINPRQPRTTKFINQSHGRLIFPPNFPLALPVMVQRSPQFLYLNIRNLTFSFARSGFDDLAISVPRKRIKQLRNIVMLSSLKG
jgi:hypothetical protein